MALNEFISKIHFYITFIGVNLTFFPQHFLGLAGMPRRYTDYPDCFYFWNKVSSFGSYITLVAAFLFVIILWEALVSQRQLVTSFSGPVRLEWVSAPSTPLEFHTFNFYPKVVLK